MQLDAKHGVVLGVANERSIAWNIAQEAHAAGARLAFNYQNERVQPSVSTLVQTIPGSICLSCDVSQDAQLDRFFAQVAQAFEGKLDFLIHSIAFAHKEDLSGRYLDTSREGFRTALDVSVYSLVACARRALPLMKAAGGGSIVAMSYYGAEKVFPNYNVMGVAKAALESSVRYLAADMGPDAVRVNAISAGPIKTLAARAITGFSEMMNVVAERAPLKRATDPKEVAQTAVFLVSPASCGITGETIYVDSGYHIMG
jgi:enoyl-[acyl-carrier protein] reductase I